MNRINTLHIHNYKFFGEKEPIELGGKHLLLYGENGSGKSSVFWSLHTLFECASKDDVGDEIKKYFKHPNDHNESLINTNAKKEVSEDAIEHYNSFIKVETNDSPVNTFEVSLLNTAISGNTSAIEINRASDFLTYKVLYKFQDFWNGEPINLANIFLGYILPYTKFDEIVIDGKTISNAYDIFNLIQNDETTIDGKKAKRKLKDTNKLIAAFDNGFLNLVEFINANSYDIIKKLGYDIESNLQYQKLSKPEKNTSSHKYYYSLAFNITKYLGEPIEIHRPQSFLNEAKITAIALAIRFAVLKKRFTDQAPDVLKFIVFDDVMISLDMNNRDRLIDYILNPVNNFTKDYQLLFLTHDKNLYDFVAFKIKQWKGKEDWVYKEMYVGLDKTSKKEYPIIIDSELEFIDKAQKYYDAKDYTACSIYIRKEVEKIINQRLPPVLKEKVDGNFLSLQTLWKNMVIRYASLDKPIKPDLIKIFDETKLLVLNPQAHFQDISLPLYKIELDKAFTLIKELKDNYPIPEYTILLAKGMKLQFKHPAENYTFDFELLSDFFIDGMSGTRVPNLPKCKVNLWQYNGTDFFSPGFNKVIDSSKVRKRDDELDKLLANLKNDSVLNITNEMFIENTSIENCIWSFKEIIDKAGITL